MFLSGFDGCRPMSLPNTNPLQSAIRQSSWIRQDNPSSGYGTSCPAFPALPALHNKKRHRSCPPIKRSSKSLAPQTLGGYPHDDIIGIDPGALPTEITPLLNPPCRLAQTEDCEDPKATLESQWSTVVHEINVLLRYTGPIFGIHVSEYLLLVIPVVCIGHLSTNGLAAITLGSMFATITGFSIVQGFTSALDTVLPATWTSSHPQLVGLWTQRMAVVMTACLMPIIALWLNAEPILLFLKQDAEVSHLAAVYLRWISLGLPAYTFNYISRRYYKSQGQFSVPTKITFFMAPVNALLTYILVFGSQSFNAAPLGFIGAPIASAISFNLMALLFLLHGIFFEPRTAWTPPSRRMFSRLGILVRLGLCGIGQIGLRLWAWELLTLAASLLGPVSLASQSILVIFASTIFRAPFALGIATLVRVGNLLGLRDAKRAGTAALTAICMVIVLSAFSSIFVTVFARYWAYIFNHDPEVVRIVARIMPLVAIFQVFHGTAAVTGAIARARGKQITGALVNLSAYYIIGFPIGIYLAFTHGAALSGLWIGMTISLICCASSGVYFCLRVNWDFEVEKAVSRLQRDKILCGCGSDNEDT